MALSEIFERIADDREPRGALESILQTTLGAAAPVYAAGSWLNRFAHESGLATRDFLPATVFSVGNVTVGGTGKTPFTIWLVEWLKEQGKRPAIVTRGYGRSDEDALVLVHDGKRIRANSHDAGDEPLLLANALKDVPVVACADRHRAGRAALKKFEIDTIVLDDGFQHHRIGRQADIVLVDATRPLSTLKPLPRGTLRESPGVLGRAHLIVLTRWNQAKRGRRTMAEIRQLAPSVPVVRAAIEPAGIQWMKSGETAGADATGGMKAVLLCGVANPTSVKRTAKDSGIEIVYTRALRDHAPFTAKIVAAAEKRRKRAGAGMVLVTEKDAVKIAELGTVPDSFAVLKSTMRLVDERDQRIADKVLKSRLHARLIRAYIGS